MLLLSATFHCLEMLGQYNQQRLLGLPSAREGGIRASKKQVLAILQQLGFQ